MTNANDSEERGMSVVHEKVGIETGDILVKRVLNMDSVSNIKEQLKKQGAAE